MTARRFLVALIALLLLPVTVGSQQSIQGFVQAERQKYPAANLTPAQLAQILNDATYRAGGSWGLLSKPSGNNCPRGDQPIACDIVFNRDTRIHFDVFRDAEGAAEVVWQEVGPMDLNRWLAPTKPEGEQGPVDPPPPPPGDNALLALLLKRIDALEAELKRERQVEINIPYLGVAKGTIK